MHLIESGPIGATLEQGFSYIKKGELGKAISVMDELIENDPYLAQAYWGRALCYECRSADSDDIEMAISDYSKSIVYAENPPALSYGRRGILYFKTGMYGEALKDLDRALELDLLWSEAMFFRARTYMALARDTGDAEHAVEDLTGVIKRSDIAFAPAYFWRAQALRLLDRAKEAAADYEKAIEIDPDDVLALNALAYCSEHGIGIDIDMDRAETLYTKAAELGFTVARKNLAWFYAGGGNAGRCDAERSAYWMRKAAADGDPEAQDLYGLRLRHGKGVPPDPYKAAYYFRQAAEQDYLPALCNLADCYEHGLGVEQDPELAFAIYEKTALAGSVTAAYNLGRHYYFGIGADEDNDRAFSILKPLADSGHARAQDMVGMCYENGYGVERDFRLAGKYYRLAWNQGYAHAAAHLAARYHFGRGVRRNPAAAVKLYTQAGEMGSSYAWYALGRLFFADKLDYKKAADAFRLAMGEGVEGASLWLARSLMCVKDPQSHIGEISSLLRENVETGPENMTAAIFLSELEYYGFCGLAPDPYTAVNRLRELIYEADPETSGLSCAYYFLARASELGYGCERDAGKAAEFYREAGDVHDAGGCRCFVTGLAHMLYQGVGCSADSHSADEMVIKEVGEKEPSGETRLLYVWSKLTDGEESCRDELLRIVRDVVRESPHDPAAAYMLYYLHRGSSASGKYLTRLRRALEFAPPCYRFMIEHHLEATPDQAMYPLITARIMDEYLAR